MICQPGKCERHGRTHTGHERTLCLEASERGEEFRLLIDSHTGTDKEDVLFSHKTAKAILTGEKPPSFLRKAVSLTKAVVKHVMGGMPIAKDSGKRLDICRGCEFYSAGNCLKCGCNVQVKTVMGLERCPVGKW